VPENEAREDKFVRLALKRMGALKSRVRQIGNLASYPHTDEQAAKIVAEVKRMAAYIEEAFTPEPETDEFNF
jgi:hypothetical protein